MCAYVSAYVVIHCPCAHHAINCTCANKLRVSSNYKCSSPNKVQLYMEQLGCFETNQPWHAGRLRERTAGKPGETVLLHYIIVYTQGYSLIIGQ